MSDYFIKDKHDYINMLCAEIDWESMDDTREALNVQICFVRALETLGWCDPVYLSTLWRVMECGKPPFLAPSVHDLQTLNYYSKRGEGWFNASSAQDYGNEIFKQVNGVIAELKRNPESRRGTIRMPGDSCLLSIQFMLRDVPDSEVIIPALITTATYRSLDAIHGVPADLFMLRKLSAIVQESFPVMEAPIIIQAGSFHIYDKDLDLL